MARHVILLLSVLNCWLWSCLLIGAEPPAVMAPTGKLDLNRLTGIVLDNSAAELAGNWIKSQHISPYLGSEYLQDGNKNKGELSARFTSTIKTSGNYAVRLSYTIGATRAANVPITIKTGQQSVLVYLDQRSYPDPRLKPFATLGVFQLTADSDTVIEVQTANTNGHVIVDAIWLEPTDEAPTSIEKLATKPLNTEQLSATAPSVKQTTPPDSSSPRPNSDRTNSLPTTFSWLAKPIPKLKKLNADQLDALIEVHLAGMTLAEGIPDEQFLRRIALDLCGRPPTEREYHEFISDNDADKRNKAVNRYLDHPDFGRNWANYWSDTIASRVQPPELTFLTYQPLKEWLATELNSGKSWSAIVHELITADGVLKDRPAATYVGYHQGNPILLAGETSRIFMGIQLSCAQCHDHPFEKWKQEEFHQLAAFFVRTQVKMPQNSSLECKITAKEKGEHQMPDNKGTAHPVVIGGDALHHDATDAQRRAALAAWLTHPENTFFAKTYVNRIWSRLLGHGFGEPVDNLGEMTEVHFPEALDALTEHFNATGHDVKDLFRVIMAGEAYQRQLPQSPEARKKLFAAARTAKLRGDEVFDSLSAATGLPNTVGTQRKPTSTDRFPPPPKSTRDRVNGVFGFDPSLSPVDVSRTMPQALYLMNNEELRKQINADPQSGTLLAKLLAEEPDNTRAVTTLYHRVLAREPRTEEMKLLLNHIQSAESRGRGFEDLLWSLINSTEFTTKR